MSKKTKLRRKITKWHRRIGLTSAIFVFMLSVTGFFLNHTSALSLGSRFISNSWLLSAYSVERPEIRSYPMGDHWLSQANTSLFLDAEYLSRCEGQLIGAVSQENYWVAICSDSLLLFSFDNELIEKIDSTVGLPLPLARAGLCDLSLCVKTRDSSLRLDLDALDWQDASAQEVQWFRPEQPPETLRLGIENNARSRVISVEKLVLDLHAGRFLGVLGPLFMDLMALCFCLFAGTGIYMWSSKRTR